MIAELLCSIFWLKIKCIILKLLYSNIHKTRIKADLAKKKIEERFFTK